MTPLARRALIAQDYAHRGLWRKGGAPENSLAAFDAARREGFGIELDVRIGPDGDAFVFHDETLDRLTGANGRFEDATLRQINALRLADGTPIPRLSDALDTIGPCPVLIELKSGRDPMGLVRAVLSACRRFRGAYFPKSFDWRIVRALRAAASPGGEVWGVGALLAPGAEPQTIAKAYATGADYLSVHVGDADRVASAARGRPQPLVTWTVNTIPLARSLRPHVDALVFDRLPMDLDVLRRRPSLS